MTARLERTVLQRTEARKRVKAKPVTRVAAPFSLRCGAMLIDYIVIAAILAFSTLFARMFGGGARTTGNSVETFGILFALFVAGLDFVVLAGLTGRTIGKWATGLRIERLDGGNLGVLRTFLRHFVGYPLSFATLGIGFLTAAVSSRGRTLHDLVAGSVVVFDGPPPEPHR
jgi:uncharacterized RDD family membrane protein YckC